MWNTLSIQYNSMIEEEWDEHYRVTCEYGSDFWKTVTFPAVNVEWVQFCLLFIMLYHVYNFPFSSYFLFLTWSSSGMMFTASVCSLTSFNCLSFLERNLIGFGFFPLFFQDIFTFHVRFTGQRSSCCCYASIDLFCKLLSSLALTF